MAAKAINSIFLISSYLIISLVILVFHAATLEPLVQFLEHDEEGRHDKEQGNRADAHTANDAAGVALAMIR